MSGITVKKISTFMENFFGLVQCRIFTAKISVHVFCPATGFFHAFQDPCLL